MSRKIIMLQIVVLLLLLLIRITATKNFNGEELLSKELLCHRNKKVSKSLFPIIQFLHIPKVGGTSIKTVLSAWANANNISINSLPIRSPGNLFEGHFGFGFSSNVSKRINYKIVVLRDPVDRVISTYNYIQQLDKRRKEAWQSWHHTTLDTIVHDYHTNGDTHSLSTFALKRIMKLETQLLCGFDCVWEFPTNASFSQYEANFPIKNAFERARRNLERCDVVAVSDELDSSLLVQLKKSPFGDLTRGLVRFPVANIGRFNEPVTAQSKALLKSWMKEEYELFSRAQSLSKIIPHLECSTP